MINLSFCIGYFFREKIKIIDGGKYSGRINMKANIYSVNVYRSELIINTHFN